MHRILALFIVTGIVGCAHDANTKIDRDVYDKQGRKVATIHSDIDDYGMGRANYAGEANAEAMKQDAAARSQALSDCTAIAAEALKADAAKDDSPMVYIECDSRGHFSFEDERWLWYESVPGGFAPSIVVGNGLSAPRGSTFYQRNVTGFRHRRRPEAEPVVYREPVPVFDRSRRGDRQPGADDNSGDGSRDQAREPVLTADEQLKRAKLFEAEVICDGMKSELLKEQVAGNAKLAESEECQWVRERVTAFHEFEAAKSIKAKEQSLLKLRRLLGVQSAAPAPRPAAPSGPVPQPAIPGNMPKVNEQAAP